MKTIRVPYTAKWYYLILEDPETGAHEELEFPDMGNYEVFGSPFVDHAPNPLHVDLYARMHGHEIDDLSLELIIGRWVLESGDTNLQRLKKLTESEGR